MELALNTGTFEVLDYSELFAVDGGWTAQQWIVGACTVVGLVVGYAVGLALAGPIAGAVTPTYGASAGAAAGAAVNIAASYVCGAIATKTAQRIIG